VWSGLSVISLAAHESDFSLNSSVPFGFLIPGASDKLLDNRQLFGISKKTAGCPHPRLVSPTNLQIRESQPPSNDGLVQLSTVTSKRLEA
jgi:hypothetical protein